MGWVRPPIAERLASDRDAFALADGELRLAAAIEAADAAARSRAVARSIARLRDAGLVPGWRDELYPIAPRPDAEPLLVVERAALPLLGARGRGVHVNGFVRVAGDLEMWLGRREPTRPAWPGRLDQIVAGGLPAGMGLRANLVKEAAEEAGIEPPLAALARPTGTVSYVCETPTGLRPDVLYCYDLELPADFDPSNRDGEVESFRRVGIGELLSLLDDPDAFKPNSALVAIDFLVRHGLIEAGAPGYAEIVAGLHAAAPFERSRS